MNNAEQSQLSVIIEEIKHLYKNDSPEKAYMLACKHKDKWSGNNGLLFITGWSLYYCVKNTKDPCQARHYLREYGKIKNLHLPSLLHSQILKAALKFSESWDGFPAFVRWWGLEKFRDEDKEPRKYEDTIYKSLREETLQALYRHVKRFGLRGEDVSWMTEFSGTFVEESSDEWIPFYHAMLLVWAGKRGVNAAGYLSKIVRRNPGKYWVWHHLGEFFEETDKRLACYCRAFICSDDDLKYRAGFYLEFIRLLVETGNYEIASSLLNTILPRAPELTQAKQNILDEWVQQNWYDKSALLDLSEFCSKYKNQAEQYIYYDLPEMRCIVDHINTKKNIVWLQYEKENGCALSLKRWPAAINLQPNQMLLIKYELKGNAKRIIAQSWRECEPAEINGLFMRFSGILQIHGDNPFGFVKCYIGSVYIPKTVVQNFQLKNRITVSGWARNSFNKQRSDWGWKCISLNK